MSNPATIILPSTLSSHHRRRRKISGQQASSGVASSNSKRSTRSTRTRGKIKMAAVTSRSAKDYHPSFSWVLTSAALYVLSGVTQPILMAYAKHAGLANPRCQLYMLFYYIGPASVGLTLRRRGSRRGNRQKSSSEKKDEVSGESSSIGDVSGVSGLQNDNLISYGTNNKGSAKDNGYDDYDSEDDDESTWPPMALVFHAASIAVFDIFAQSMCYTGNNLAGPTIFAIIYSSVTIWAAIYSNVLLSRTLNCYQWMGVCLVVLGLSLTAMYSLSSGENVFVGACLILVGSSGHGLVYVLSEKVMIPPPSAKSSDNTIVDEATKIAITTTVASKMESRKPIQLSNNGGQLQTVLSPLKRKTKAEPKHISVRANCAIQGTVATVALLLWQLVYTLPRFDSLILAPMHDAGTSSIEAFWILSGIALANLLHSVTFFQTLKFFPGGATSAGVLKGLQAVMVFVASSVLLCGRWGGLEMCWSGSKFLSLIVVVGGIFLYATSTDLKKTKKDGFTSQSDGGYVNLRGVKPEDVTGVTMSV
mmetsp:Transcript_10624/g.22215  ORF Transcript_10624/g.22215 Transcript_10624/m.22215 type:complete len:533 (-) Transcript_10624:199-1797(-)